MNAIMVIAAALYGGVLSRWHGGGFISGSPKVLKNSLWALPFAAVSFLALHAHGVDGWPLYLAAAVSFALCLFGKATGHGGGMDLAHSPKEPGGNPSRTLEKLERLIFWLYDKLPRYWYDFTLLVVIGLASTSGAALALGYVNPLAGLIVAAGGAMKAVAYAIGWRLHDLFSWPDSLPKDFDEPTELGEFLTGAFAFTGLAIGAIMVL